jgi:hypothetical protein
VAFIRRAHLEAIKSAYLAKTMQLGQYATYATYPGRRFETDMAIAAGLHNKRECRSGLTKGDR